MGADLIPAIVYNKTSMTTLLVLNGNAQSPPTLNDLSTVAPGDDSSTSFNSIDAFGAYLGQVPVSVIYGGGQCCWWKIPDGVICKVSMGVDGNYYLDVMKTEWPGAAGLPSPSTPDFWGCDPAAIAYLLGS